MPKWYHWILNPVGSVIDEVNNLINPDIKGQQNSDKTIQQKIDSTKEVLSEPARKVKNVVDKYVNNVTGERDTAENEKNREFQSEEAQIARDWQAEQAQIAREWDSIGAQMERAVGAGVNPISIAMQNGGINGSATSPMPSSPGIPAGSNGLMHNGIFDAAAAVFNGIGTFAEQRLKQSQSDDIVLMRQYNIAEKIANTDHLRQLCTGVELSNVAQRIQNSWLDVMNQATYDGMLLENGVKRATILEKRSVAKLNMQQIDSIKQSMELDLQRFNATLPLELQLTQEEISLKHASVQQVYTEISMRHLQKIEQENRNRQSSSEAESAEIAANLAKSTYEDAVAAFHNDMVKGAAECGVSLYDYQYYGVNAGSMANLPGRIIFSKEQRKMRKNGWRESYVFDKNIKGVNDDLK